MHTRDRTSSPAARGPAAGVLAVLALLALLGVLRAAPARAYPVAPGAVWHPPRKTREDRVRAVLKAAWKARGTPYRYGGTSPDTGFDCSGFTRWAWSHGGDALPHNADEQYHWVRWHVKRPWLKPGDLLFFYSPISHVGIYVGRGKMIDAEHTGTTVHLHPVYWQYFTAAARPR